MASVECACAAAGALVYENGVTAKGAIERIGDDFSGYIDTYKVGACGESGVALVLGTDIFGFSVPNMKANADMLAASMGCLVVVPDHFRGHSAGQLDLSDPASREATIRAFVQEHGQVETAKQDLLTKVVPHLEAHGAAKIFYLGFCWGGMIALALVADSELAARFAGAGGIHASLKEPQGDVTRAKAAKVPLMLLQSRNDADVRPVLEALQGGEHADVLGRKHVVRTYHDQEHGFCGARGDRSDPHVAAAVRSALQTAIEFFATAAA